MLTVLFSGKNGLMELSLTQGISQYSIIKFSFSWFRWSFLFHFVGPLMLFLWFGFLLVDVVSSGSHNWAYSFLENLCLPLFRTISCFICSKSWANYVDFVKFSYTFLIYIFFSCWKKKLTPTQIKYIYFIFFKLEIYKL